METTQNFVEYENKYPDHLVVMQNRMVEAWHSMTIDEKRLFIIASPIARLTKLTQDSAVTITAQEYAELCGIEVKTAYDGLRDAADKLLKRYFSYLNEKGKRVKVNWVIRTIYDDGSIQMYFPSEVIFMLTIFGKQNPYTIYNKTLALKLRSVYAQTFYELFKQFQKIGKREMEVSHIKDILELHDKPSYKRVFNIDAKIITPAINEINSKTDLNVTYEHKKVGRSIKSFIFSIKKKKGFSDDVIDNDERDERVIEHGFVTFKSDKQLNWVAMSISKLQSITSCEIIEIKELIGKNGDFFELSKVIKTLLIDTKRQKELQKYLQEIGFKENYVEDDENSEEKVNFSNTLSALKNEVNINKNDGIKVSEDCKNLEKRKAKIVNFLWKYKFWEKYAEGNEDGKGTLDRIRAEMTTESIVESWELKLQSFGF